MSEDDLALVIETIRHGLTEMKNLHRRVAALESEAERRWTQAGRACR